MQKMCHKCGRTINLDKMDEIDDYYFHQVMSDGDDLYWCGWECIENHTLTDIKWRRWLINKLNKIETITIDFTA